MLGGPSRPLGARGSGRFLHVLNKCCARRRAKRRKLALTKLLLFNGNLAVQSEFSGLHLSCLSVAGLMNSRQCDSEMACSNA